MWKNEAAAVIKSMVIPQKIEVRIIIWCSNSTFMYTPGRIAKRDSNRCCTPMFIGTLFTVANRWKQLKCSLIGEWIKEIYIYIWWNVIQT